MAHMNDIRPAPRTRPMAMGGVNGVRRSMRSSGRFSASGLLGVGEIDMHGGGSGAAMRMNPTAARLAGMRVSESTPKTHRPTLPPAPRVQPQIPTPAPRFERARQSEPVAPIHQKTQAPAVPAPNRRKMLIKQGINLAVYVLILGGIVFGLPKYLVWQFNTSYPMAAITSGSMWPVLKKGDLVVIRGVSKQELAVGDIIVFKNPENHTLTIHRIVRMDASTLTTKGDANFREDQPVPYENVVGKTVLWEQSPVRMPWVGSVTMLVNSFIASTSKTQGTSS